MRHNITAYMLFSIYLLTVLTFTACSKEDKEFINLEGTLEVVPFENTDELLKHAYDVIHIEVSGRNETIEYGEMLFTLTDATVIQDSFSLFENEQNILIFETGGITDKKEVTFGDEGLLKKGNEYLVYVQKYEGPVTNKESYVVLGVYQGRFDVKDGEISHSRKLYDNIENMNIEIFFDTLIEENR